MGNPDRYLGIAGALAASAALTLTLAACGGGDDGDSGDGGGGGEGKITREQWESVEPDATKDEILDEFGPPTDEAEYEGLTYTANYRADPEYGGDTGGLVAFTFDPESGEFQSKSWLETFDPHATIDASLFAKVSNGMTQDQVESALGQPGTIEDGVTTLSFGLSGQEVEPGVPEHCLSYPWRNSDFAAVVCFDESGKVTLKSHATSDNPATVPPPN